MKPGMGGNEDRELLRNLNLGILYQSPLDSAQGRI